MLSGSQPGVMQLGLTMGMFFLLIMILYLTNFDPSDKGSAWTALVLLIIDVYVKVVAIFIGFGVCSVDQVPATLSTMTNTLLGGRRRR
jgi:FtsH-binding integral membrane protein